MLAGTTEAVKVGARAITKLKTLERAKITVRNNEKHLRGLLWVKC